MKTLSTNPKANFDYNIEKELVCGIILYGEEVKAIRDHRGNIRGEYCTLGEKGVYTKFHIGTVNEPNRVKTILCTKKERERMYNYLREGGTTLIPLEIFQDEKTIIKIRIGFCRGKKLYEKRHSIRERDLSRRGDGND